ncbi:Protein of unknown function [Flavobacterium indicum GPTSA100-9 = DSM 17447]|uniref:Immunity protein 53 n=1 Tax=Flavobacterium indicum (strain DSM 17447 / CIP 109464 / GPTSA100-9) TaxID=1094466 RepID=H8XNR2_FLAIG|nr:immunity 53 family protein [Flavobacterium indicum]CCG52179.1 Protein of unknown function [Flavobacterium indicum GPTSA100-9 = DSM 17447]
MLKWFEEWFYNQCNEDWEHGYGIKIETIDNPGWEITIDLENTKINLEKIDWILIGDYENSWVGYKIEEKKFNGACSPKNLNILIQIFKEINDFGLVDVSKISSLLK